MRLFAAILLSDEMKTSVVDMMHALKKQDVKGRYVPASNLHVTLAFLGEVKDASAVEDALRGVSVRPIRLAFDGTGTFGNLMWIGLKGNQGLSMAARDVRTALDEAGIGYDRKKFLPHITIIREMSGKWQAVPAPKGEMMVKKISLMKSEVKDGRRIYTEIWHSD